MSRAPTIYDLDGSPLKATHKVEKLGGQVTVVLEGWSGAKGSPTARNEDYIPALRLILERLADMGAVLTDAALELTRGQRADLPLQQRRLDLSAVGGYPVALVGRDPEQLRQQLGHAQRGNQVQRIRLYLGFPSPEPTVEAVEAAIRGAPLHLWQAAYWILYDAPEGLYVDAAWAQVQRTGWVELSTLTPEQSLSAELQRRSVGYDKSKAIKGPRHFERVQDARSNTWTLSEWGRRHPPCPRPRRTGGGGSPGGFSTSSERNKAVEEHAMRAAKAYCKARGWHHIEDTSATMPYDLECTGPDGTRLYVEVKGTTGDGAMVLLTQGEVDHARKHAGRCALFVLAHVRVEENGEVPRAVGGEQRVIEDWRPAEGDLRGITLRYRVPGLQSES